MSETTSEPSATSDEVTPSEVTPEVGGPSVEEAVGEVADEPSDGAEQSATAPKKRRRSSLIEWLIVIGVAALAAFLVRTFVVEQFKVDGQSMESTLHDGDRVLVNKLGYRFHDPNRGDVVVLEPVGGRPSRTDLIKRVIGLPGETLSMSSTTCKVIVDGKELVEPYLDPEATSPGGCGPELPTTTVPAGHVLVMGDHRNASLDSRAPELGVVSFDQIVGRAFVVIWPKGSWQWL